MPLSTLKELDAVREQCRKLVQRRALLSAAAAVVPIPGVDIGTDVAILLKVLPQINEKFGLSPTQIDNLSPDLQKIIMVGSVSAGTGFIGKTLTTQRVIDILQRAGLKKLAGKSASKFIPLAGSLVAASISFVILRKVANQHIDECYDTASKVLLAHNAKSRTVTA
jgi:uncharacterized protein (DUF697 family)